MKYFDKDRRIVDTSQWIEIPIVMDKYKKYLKEEMGLTHLDDDDLEEIARFSYCYFSDLLKPLEINITSC